MKNKYIKYIVILVLALFTFIPSTKALEENIVNIHLFYSKVCPHCAKEIKVINELVPKLKSEGYQFVTVSELYEIKKIRNKLLAHRDLVQIFEYEKTEFSLDDVRQLLIDAYQILKIVFACKNRLFPRARAISPRRR